MGEYHAHLALATLAPGAVCRLAGHRGVREPAARTATTSAAAWRNVSARTRWTPTALLTRIGWDCVGALQFLPEAEEPGAGDVLTGEPLSDAQIAAILKDLHRTPLGIRAERDFRISVAGAQEKTARLFHDGQWVEPTGTTPTTHLLKPAIGTLPNGMDLTDSIENEHFCLRLMAAFGLKVAHTEIASFAGTKVLVVERFDRLPKLLMGVE